MANIKISQLPTSSAITGSELVPVVQAGVTKQATAAQITATASASAAAASAAAASAAAAAAAKVASVTASSPLSSTGGTAPNISLSGVVPVGNGGTGITSLGAGVATWLGTPSSANLAAAVTDETGSGALVFNASPSISSPTVSSGNITFSGLAQRIAGDFSNATQNSRLLFQSSTLNGNTLVGAVPNGTATTASWQVFNAADPTNSSVGSLAVNGTTDVRLTAGAIGSGTQLPLTFYVNGNERIRVGTNGFVGIGTATATPTDQLELGAGNLLFSSTAQRITGDMSNATLSNRLMFQTSTTNGATGVFALPNGTGTSSLFGAFGASDSANAPFASLYAATTDIRLTSGITGTASYAPMTFYTGGSERVRIDTSGNVGIGTASPGYLLDVTGTSVVARLNSSNNTNVVAISYTGTIGGYVGANGTNLVFANNAGSEAMRIDTNKNVIAGASAALATNATDGFLYVPTCAGTPTGTPTAITGMAPIVVNTTNNKLYFYSGGAWRDAGP